MVESLDDDFWIEIYRDDCILHDDVILDRARADPKTYLQMSMCSRFRIEEGQKYKKLMGLIKDE